MAIELKKAEKTFVDISLAFLPSPVTNDLTVLRDERAIINAVTNLIMFIPQEVPFDRDTGSYTQRFLFDPLDDATAILLENEIRRAITFGEPRVTFDMVNDFYDDVSTLDTIIDREGQIYNENQLGVFVEPQPEKNNFQVNVKFRIVGTNNIIRVQRILTPTR